MQRGAGGAAQPGGLGVFVAHLLPTVRPTRRPLRAGRSRPHVDRSRLAARRARAQGARGRHVGGQLPVGLHRVLGLGRRAVIARRPACKSEHGTFYVAARGGEGPRGLRRRDTHSRGECGGRGQCGRCGGVTHHSRWRRGRGGSIAIQVRRGRRAAARPQDGAAEARRIHGLAPVRTRHDLCCRGGKGLTTVRPGHGRAVRRWLTHKLDFFDLVVVLVVSKPVVLARPRGR